MCPIIVFTSAKELSAGWLVISIFTQAGIELRPAERALDNKSLERHIKARN